MQENENPVGTITPEIPETTPETTPVETTAGFEATLRKLGLSEDVIQKMRSSIENMDLEGYFNQAKEYLGDKAVKARDYAKENKKVIAAALGVVAVAAGVLIAVKMSRGKNEDDKDRV